MELVTDLSSPKEKQVVLEFVRGLQGMHRVVIVKYRKRRTDVQNRFYWPAVVQPFGDYLRGQGCELTDEDCHEMLKLKFLRLTVVDPGTGEIIGERTRSTTELNIEEFSEYLEKCIAYLSETFGIEVQAAGVLTEQQ